MTCEFLVGVRDERPALLEHARALDAGVVISANAFNRRWTRRMRDADEPFPGFKPAATDGRWTGLRVHLDSGGFVAARQFGDFHRSEEHTSELQSLMRISYAVFCL